MSVEVNILHVDEHERARQIDTMIFDGDGQVFPNSPKEEICNVFTISQKRSYKSSCFLHPDKHQSFLQAYFNTFGIEVSYNVILSLLMFMVKHSQSIQSNKFAISLEYLKKEVRDGFHFLHPIKHQSFYKLALSFLMKVDRHVQSAQNRKFVIFFTIS